VGKTRLFYRFVAGDSLPADVPTVSSLQANVGISSSTSSTSSSPPQRIRWVDWPGHASVQDGALDAVIWKNTKHPVRLVLVVDATQLVASAATVLYQLWEQLATKTKASSSSPSLPLPLLIACHKQDMSKAKTTKRIALQLRTALERLVTTNHPKWWPTNTTSYAIDDWSLLAPYLTLHWAATSAIDGTPGLSALEDFGFHGIVPSEI
jgi:hypothetical protein